MEQESRVNQDGGEEAGRDAPEEQIVEQAPQEESTTASAGMAYAGFWRRFVAMVIDSIILGIVSGVMTALVGAPMMLGESDPAKFMEQLLHIQVINGIIILLIAWLYYALLESSSSRASLGKMALGIVVVDLEGNRLSFARASGRIWGKWVSTLIILIGYIMAAFTERKQALHDIMAGCLVVRK